MPKEKQARRSRKEVAKERAEVMKLAKKMNNDAIALTLNIPVSYVIQHKTRAKKIQKQKLAINPLKVVKHFKKETIQEKRYGKTPKPEKHVEVKKITPFDLSPNVSNLLMMDLRARYGDATGKHKIIELVVAI